MSNTAAIFSVLMGVLVVMQLAALALTIRADRKAVQDALQRIGDENDTLRPENKTDQNENVSIAGNRHHGRSQP